MIEINHVKKIYRGSGGVRALKDVSLTIPQGEIIGLFGENGAGKTTLMKCILDFIPYEGQITLDGEPVTRKNIHKLSFATSEHSFFSNLNAKEHREFYEEHFEHFRRKRFEALMEFFHLPMNKAIRGFSTGQKNQFEVILALCQGADYILMDEPFAGNDIFNRADFYKVLLGILEPEETILLSTHLIEEVSGFIGRAVLIHSGDIVGDVTADQLDERGENLMDYIRTAYNYKADRVSRALEQLTQPDENV